jgi:signal transduction histidine kinase/CheY-like chemotaxis protein
MRRFPQGIWRYAILLVLLLCIAAVASRETLMAIQQDLSAAFRDGEEGVLRESMRIITLSVLALTMGFLFLSGSLGIWVIRSTTIMEGLRRLGRFVDGMDYLSDGLLAVDRRGRVTGSNPAARVLSGRDFKPGLRVRDLFPCLDKDKMESLLGATAAREVECVYRQGQSLKALRFRSQPAEDVTLILVSDITGVKAEEMRAQQIARHQLIGRIARGVAHDFNNILCAISGYAALLKRDPGVAGSDLLKSVERESERGAALAAKLVDLSRAGLEGPPCRDPAAHLDAAAALLRVGLSSGWRVVTDVEGVFPVVPLTDAQVEQLVASLGFQVADAQAQPSVLRLRLRAPGAGSLIRVGTDFACVLLVMAGGGGDEAAARMADKPGAGSTESGVIPSVVRSMVEEVGGRLDLIALADGRHAYRVCLPELPASGAAADARGAPPAGSRVRSGSWRVLLAAPASARVAALESYLREMGITVIAAADIVSALQRVEAESEVNVMVLDRDLLGQEADALIRAILKLRPAAGVVVLASATDADMPENLRSQVVVEQRSASPESIVQALISARERAEGRQMP